MIEAKEGNIDVEYFKNIIQNNEITETSRSDSFTKMLEVQVDYISGWILNFFAYYGKKSYSTKKIEFLQKVNWKLEILKN